MLNFLYRFEYQIGYDQQDNTTSIMQVVIAQSVVITAYPVPQEMEEICECNYILFNIFKYKKKLGIY